MIELLSDITETKSQLPGSVLLYPLLTVNPKLSTIWPKEMTKLQDPLWTAWVVVWYSAIRKDGEESRFMERY